MSMSVRLPHLILVEEGCIYKDSDTGITTIGWLSHW